MKQEIYVKGTFLHSAGAKYEEMLAAGQKVEDPVTFRETGAFIEAIVDGQPIGHVETKGFDIPKLYTATIKDRGTEPKSFLIEVDTEKAAGARDYANEIAETARAGFTEEEIEKRLTYMAEEGFSSEVVSFVLAYLAEYGHPDIKFIVNGDHPVYRRISEKEESPVSKMIRATKKQKCLILKGEKSTGKNVASRTVAMLLGAREYRVGFQRDMGPDDAFGGKTTDNSAADSLNEELALASVLYNADPVRNAGYADDAAKFELLKAKSASTRVVQAESALIEWAKKGGVIMFDEINMAHANMLQAIMNPLTDGDKTLVVPGGERIRIHPACAMFGGMNPGYAGTMDLNKATKSRSGFLKFKEADSIEPQLKANFAETSKLSRHFNACDKLYKDFKAAVSQGRISNDCLNIRGFVSALEQVEEFPQTTTLAAEIETFVIDGCDDDEALVLNAMLRDKIVF